MNDLCTLHAVRADTLQSKGLFAWRVARCRAQPLGCIFCFWLVGLARFSGDQWLVIAAIVFYVRVKKDNLVKPMVTGWKDIDPAEHAESATGGGVIALIVSLTIACAAVYAASGVWLPKPSPQPAAVSVPSW
jgi:hypothetical protein